jgi:hypothetical protein
MATRLTALDHAQAVWLGVVNLAVMGDVASLVGGWATKLDEGHIHVDPYWHHASSPHFFYMESL